MITTQESQIRLFLDNPRESQCGCPFADPPAGRFSGRLERERLVRVGVGVVRVGPIVTIWKWSRILQLFLPSLAEIVT
jgi:hypothetical protein